METNFKAGDIVYLKSGSDPMVLFEIDGENASVIFANPKDNEITSTSDIPLFALTLTPTSHARFSNAGVMYQPKNYPDVYGQTI